MRSGPPFEMSMQPTERIVPLFRDELEAFFSFYQRLRIKFEETFAPRHLTAHEADTSQDLQVLCDRLPADWCAIR